MSLKCSVLGHRFAEADVTRERQEQGSEVVITITETETCERCGETRVLSENKEVTTLETPSDIVGEELDREPAGTADPDSEPPAGGRESDAGADTDTPPDRSPGPDAETGPKTDPESDPTPDPDPDGPADPATGPPGGSDAAEVPADDAELIDEAESGAARDADEQSDDPTAGTNRSAVADVHADQSEDDGVILDEGETDDERAPGEWPQETDATPGDDWKPETDTGELRPVEEEQPERRSTGETVPLSEGEFHCPECGFDAQVASSSLREGDFCPECHRGSLQRTLGQ
jgi:hypothetical protein